jgi:hypothetical protein
MAQQKKLGVLGALFVVLVVIGILFLIAQAILPPNTIPSAY